MNKKLSTQPYKGTRDFYPEDMAVQQYIFDTWAKTAESFGYARFDASILEPSELYKSKGAENEEMVNEQTYTFTDRGDREVTLRPEMTPTVARMVAARQRELRSPVRWYSIPNLFRYERPQRGRLREHWQFNCDIFGVETLAIDIEMITLAHNILLVFGATEDMFEVRVNHRGMMTEWYTTMGIVDTEKQNSVTKLNDRKSKISASEYKKALKEIVGDTFDIPSFITALEDKSVSSLNENSPLRQVITGLQNLGVTNIVFDRTLARGFNYYTGTVFEIFDTSDKNNRSLVGGGRYDNLTELFGGNSLPGAGFGIGDVTMRDFLETHKLLPESVHVTAATLTVIPTDASMNIEAEKIAQSFRTQGTSTAVDFSSKRTGKKISVADKAGTRFILVVGEDEVKSGTFTVKELATKSETTGMLEELITSIS